MGISERYLDPASVNTILKALKNNFSIGYDEQPLSGHLFKVGTALILIEQGESLEKIMFRRGWQADSTATSYLKIGAYGVGN